VTEEITENLTSLIPLEKTLYYSQLKGLCIDMRKKGDTGVGVCMCYFTNTHDVINCINTH